MRPEAGSGAGTLEWWRPLPPEGAAPAGPPAEAVRARAGLPVPSQSAVPFVALCAFSFVMLLAPQSIVPALAPFRLALVAGLIALSATIGPRFFQGRPIGLWTREVKIAVALGAWTVVTLPFSMWPGGSVNVLTGTFFKSLALFWLNANVIDSVPRLKRLTLVLALCSLPLAMTAMRHYLAGDVTAGGSYKEFMRIEGYDAPLTHNPNDLALMLNLLLPFAVAQAMLARNRAARLGLWGLAALDAVGVVLTFSRGGFLTLATIAFLFYRHLQKRKSLPSWLVPAALAGLLALPLLANTTYVRHLMTIANYKSDPTGSAQARFGDMVTATRVSLNHPLIGAGAGMNTLALNEARGPAWKMIHNVYLEYAVDLGLPGLLLFLMLFFGCVKAARRGEDAGVPGEDDEESATLAACGRALRYALIGFGVAAVFHPVAYHFYFYGLGGLAVAVGALAYNNNEDHDAAH
jgi:hypothetical protein